MGKTFKNKKSLITPYMASWIAEIEKDISTGKNILGPFTTRSELDEFLYLVIKDELLA